MKINLHFLPEKPYGNCEVLVFHTNETGEIIHATNVNYCAKFRLFNAYDWSEIDDADYEYQEDIVAWAYMSEVQEELNYEIQ